MTVFDQIQAYGDNIAIIEDDNKAHTYNDLLSDANLISEQIPPANIVLCLCQNSYAAIAGYVGFIKTGCIPLLLAHTVAPSGLENILAAYRPEFIYAPLEAANTHSLGRPLQTLENYGLFKTTFKNKAIIHKDLALLLTTSGSTGSPTVVRLSGKNIAANAGQIAEYLQIKPEDRAITTMPMSYSYGLSIINSHLLKGASIVVTEAPLVSAKFWDIMCDMRVTTFGGVPFIYEMLKKLRFHKMDLPHLRYITQAGGKLSALLLKYFIETCQSLNVSFYTMYGQTEATARISYMPPEMLEKKPDSIGISIPNGEIWIENEAGDHVTNPNEAGELVFKGPNVSLGTAENRGNLTNGDENKGLLYTGDIVTCDTDGYFRIVGRKKRFLKLFGNRINLDEIESLLGQDGFSVAVSGSDAKMHIYVENSKNQIGSQNLDPIKNLIKTKTTISPRGYKIIPIEKIPRTDSGKINYHLLNSNFSTG